MESRAFAEPYRTPGQRLGQLAVRALGVLGFVFLLAPIVAVIPLSLNDGSFLSYPLQGMSLRWYEAVFAPTPWMPERSPRPATAA